FILTDINITGELKDTATCSGSLSIQRPEARQEFSATFGATPSDGVTIARADGAYSIRTGESSLSPLASGSNVNGSVTYNNDNKALSTTVNNIRINSAGRYYLHWEYTYTVSGSNRQQTLRCSQPFEV